MPDDGEAANASNSEKLNWFKAIEVVARKGLEIIGDNPPEVARPSVPLRGEPGPAPHNRRRFRK
jgi:hypothetical protein